MSFLHVINFKIIIEIFFCYIFLTKLEIQCVIYNYSTFQLRLATYWVLNSHMWLLATIWDSID